MTCGDNLTESSRTLIKSVFLSGISSGVAKGGDLIGVKKIETIRFDYSTEI